MLVPLYTGTSEIWDLEMTGLKNCCGSEYVDELINSSNESESALASESGGVSICGELTDLDVD